MTISTHLRILKINITPKLSCSEHLNSIASRERQRLLRHTKSLLSSDIMSNLYKSLVRSALEYCSPCAGACSTYLGYRYHAANETECHAANVLKIQALDRRYIVSNFELYLSFEIFVIVLVIPVLKYLT